MPEEAVVVAVELVPGGGVTMVSLRLGETRTVPLRDPVVGVDGARYEAIAISIDRTTGLKS